MPKVMLEAQSLEREVKEFGNGAHVTVPSDLLGREVEVTYPAEPTGDLTNYYEFREEVTDAEVGDWLVAPGDFEETGEVREIELDEGWFRDVSMESIRERGTALVAKERLYTGGGE